MMCCCMVFYLGREGLTPMVCTQGQLSKNMPSTNHSPLVIHPTGKQHCVGTFLAKRNRNALRNWCTHIKKCVKPQN